ncbi:MAG: prolipoprotein diacylglyceryl transferase [Endomicrobium sp.]|jgi:phosphatidylglycerol:prolipoprotein diacylglycerol transferase|nr:prolipoprotein diacylglyceryl transferase [Endomicrobium sp.]
MYPVFKLGFFVINAYTFFMICGFWIAFVYAMLILKSVKIKFLSENDPFYILICLLFSSIFGAKAAFLIAERPDIFFANPLSLFKIWESGFIYYGGIIGASLCIILYSKIRRIPIKFLCDTFAPTLPINVFFIRTGCLFAGCCYGRETLLPWGMKSGTDILRHPTQIYEMIGAAVLFLFLHFYNKKHFGEGKILPLYFIGYAAIRFIVEFFRGDERGGYFLSMSVSQNISILAFAAALITIYAINKKNAGQSKRQNLPPL